MKEIEFRGKDRTGIMNHSWFYGSLDLQFNPKFPKIICKDRFDNEISVYVNPSTVGQYTGLKDKNGKKIFEGDIILHTLANEKYKVIWKIGLGFRLERISQIKFDGFCLDEEFCDTYAQVIGNEHDNPELLRC